MRLYPEGLDPRTLTTAAGEASMRLTSRRVSLLVAGRRRAVELSSIVSGASSVRRGLMVRVMRGREGTRTGRCSWMWEGQKNRS